MVLSRTDLFVIAVFLVAFVALHPYLGPLEFCGPGGSPHGIEAHASSSVDPGAAVTLAIAPAALAAFLRPTSDRQPPEAYLPPEPHPPRLFSVR
ncbi:MAG: hypothetical protein M3R38_24825 [Actinomycetota bacterium]|nr:hypothetical protein [Actinomycetota bacterium]